MAERIRGTVRTWKENGYGFLSSEGNKDVFCHFRSLKNTSRNSLEPGTEVEFEIVPGKLEGTFQAADVIVLNQTDETVGAQA
jgi:CspA family cold shock protein